MENLLTEIALVFENGETVNVPKKFIQEIRIEGVDFSISEGDIWIYADDIFITIDESASIACGDITCVELQYSGGERETIFPAYEDSFKIKIGGDCGDG